MLDILYVFLYSCIPQPTPLHIHAASCHRWISRPLPFVLLTTLKGFAKGVLASAGNNRTKHFSQIAEIANINSLQTPLRALNSGRDFTCEVVQVKLKLFVIL